MLHLVLADAELELVPEGLHDHPQVRAEARRRDVKPGETVLDATLHHAAMQDLPDGDRRGRPDIVHFWLLTVLASRACKAGRVRPWIHLRGDRWVTVDPETRLPKHLDRWKGLARQLLAEDRIGPKGRDLLRSEPGTLADGLASLPEPVVVLDEDGRPATAAGIVDAAGPEGTVVTGGFPSGPYRSDLPDGPRLALGDEPMMAWAVAGEVVAEVARRLDDPSGTP